MILVAERTKNAAQQIVIKLYKCMFLSEQTYVKDQRDMKYFQNLFAVTTKEDQIVFIADSLE